MIDKSKLHQPLYQDEDQRMEVKVDGVKQVRFALLESCVPGLGLPEVFRYVPQTFSGEHLLLHIDGSVEIITERRD